MPSTWLRLGTAFAAVAILTACTSPKSPTSVDAKYGVPPYSVPSDMMKPDGFMTNGLLPAQPYS
jgi:hypothetical protein